MTADVLNLSRSHRTADEETVRRSIKALMARHDMNVEELAELSGMARTTIYKRLAPGPGPGQSLALPEAIALARVFGVTVDDLINGRTDHGVLVRPTSTTNGYRKGRAA